jgi:hypothetical protein
MTRDDDLYARLQKAADRADAAKEAVETATTEYIHARVDQEKLQREWFNLMMAQRATSTSATEQK